MQNDSYTRFLSLHNADAPLILYNCWNAATARLVDEPCLAVATSSYAIAESLGYKDGEQMPFSLLLQIVAGIAKNSINPLTVDIETGYGMSTESIKQNILVLLKLGVVGINLEDQVLGAEKYTLVSIEEQCDKIAEILSFVSSNGYRLFINARTDVFFMEKEQSKTTADTALERCHAYHKAGAGCVFMPGLTDTMLMQYIVTNAPLPINIMMTDNSPDISTLAQTGVKRISYGPLSYFQANSDFKNRMKEAMHDHR